jgi:hypothetical protein
MDKYSTVDLVLYKLSYCCADSNLWLVKVICYEEIKTVVRIFHRWDRDIL